MVRLSTAQRCLWSFLASAVLTPQPGAAFLPGFQISGTTQRLCTSRRTMTAQQPEDGKAGGIQQATSRKKVFQEVSTMARVIAATAGVGSVLMGESEDAEATVFPILTSSSGVVTADDREGVEQTTIRWKDTVTLGTPDAPKKTADLYALDGVLWGTVSEEVRDTPGEIYDYFDYFARLPKLRLAEYTPVSVRIYGDFATQAGTYTFAWEGADGKTKEKRARFSFTFRRDSKSPTGWTIVEHHSSAMPTSPAELKRARNDVF